MDTTVVHSPRRTVVPLRVVLTLGALGIAFDVATNGTAPGIATPLFVVFLALALRAHLHRSREVDLLLGAAVVLTSFAALHDTIALLALDAVAAAAALALAATRGGESIFATSVLALVRRVFHLAEAAVQAPIVALATVARAAGHVEGRRARAWLRATLVALPVLAVFVGLLASADRVFGNLVLRHVPSLDLTGVARHAFLIVAGGGAAGVLWLAAQRAFDASEPGEADGAARAHPLRFAEWGSVLVGLNVVFAIFVGVQFAFLFGGGDHVRVTKGLTYAEYARSGFFQLIAVAALVALVILGVWDLGAREDHRRERWFRWSVTGLVALTAVVLASAVMRLTLYEQTFGFTVTRVTAYAIVAWIGLVLAVLVAAIWTGARKRVIAGTLAAAFVVLVGVNALNPERFVAQRNIARFGRTQKIDVAYLGTLGADAVPALASALRALPPAEAQTLRAALCADATFLRAAPHGWRSANLARARAEQSLQRARVRPCHAAP
jgi:hypothetical protein